MRNQRFFFSLCLACLLVSACVSKEKYEELERIDLFKTQS